MNKQQRKDWEDVVEAAVDEALVLEDKYQIAIVAVNAYVLKLERELQNIKQGKRIAAILMPHGGPR